MKWCDISTATVRMGWRWLEGMSRCLHRRAALHKQLGDASGWHKQHWAREKRRPVMLGGYRDQMTAEGWIWIKEFPRVLRYGLLSERNCPLKGLKQGNFECAYILGQSMNWVEKVKTHERGCGVTVIYLFILCEHTHHSQMCRSQRATCGTCFSPYLSLNSGCRLGATVYLHTELSCWSCWSSLVLLIEKKRVMRMMRMT